MEQTDLIEEVNRLKNYITELEDKLQKYTNSEGHKRYYEKNKESIIQKAAENLKKIKEDNPDKIKEYRRRAYLKSKEKKLNI
jgi:hypothetical protein